ncbi:MAG: hypothetical protein ING19_11630 [Azospirillum sp.]|nr:hypothetical protein [Azospirillum sp.]
MDETLAILLLDTDDRPSLRAERGRRFFRPVFRFRAEKRNVIAFEDCGDSRVLAPRYEIAFDSLDGRRVLDMNERFVDGGNIGAIRVDADDRPRFHDETPAIPMRCADRMNIGICRKSSTSAHSRQCGRYAAAGDAGMTNPANLDPTQYAFAGETEDFIRICYAEEIERMLARPRATIGMRR